MRTLALAEGLLVFVSSVWQTTSTALRAGHETWLIDSVVHPDELVEVRASLDRRGWSVGGLMVTHGDWDHLFSRAVYPDAPVTVAESTHRRLDAAPAEAQAAADAFDAEQYIDGRAAIELGQPLHVVSAPGTLQLEDRRIELVPTPGHTVDGVAFHLGWLHTLVCGDYLSPVEIPMLNASGAVGPYLETLERLGPVLDGVDIVVPGHGVPISRERARAIHAEDLEYVRALARDPGSAAPPASRDNPRQRAIHADNLARLRS